jgi:predicted PurR-regulated permease PerM
VAASEILVIILSVFLALFLLLAIVLTVLLIKVTQQIKSVTETAQSTVEKINAFAGTVTKVTSPAILAKMALDQIKKMKK